MTHKIDGGKGPNLLERLARKEPSKPAKAKEQATLTDRVEFSSVLQQMTKNQESAAPREAARAEKLQALKEQIANGSYQPDLTQVAKSLLRAMRDGRTS